MESFDAEALRAIFVAGVFNFETHIIFRNVRSEYIRMWLVASTLRPNLVHSTTNAAHPVSTAISTIADLLLEGTKSYRRDQLRLKYILFDAFKGNSYFSKPAKHLLPAAAAVEDGEFIRRLVRQKADPYEQSSLFGYAYRNSARRGKRPVVDYSLSLPPDALSSHTDCRTALAAAAGGGHISFFEPLLQHIKLPEYKWIMSLSLYKAAGMGRLPAVEFLLNAGANPNVNRFRSGALELAARHGFTRVVRLLFERGAVYHANMPNNPLCGAAGNGHVDILQLLLEHWADFNVVESTDSGAYYSGLAWAARNGETSMVKFLLANGVDLKSYKNGPCALKQAAERGHEDIARLLVRLGVQSGGQWDD
ncbi:MAG: hypothetical protein LQ341_004330 [Variospora aurantia]|nr:MAG: hypothetical protein LQ341_004330 [Variospora aurantia]